ncbi:MAG: SulP family inorganic anion transporter [Pseudomonadota bacterium]|nr:SulP family inorganic anion transporter [Pseudomonadota bacterium]
MLDWLAEYRPAWFRGDLIAGLTSAAVVIPKAMAYATVAELPVEVGLYYSALKMLIEGEERLHERGVELWLVALNPEVLRMVKLSLLGNKLGRERLIFNLQTAVERYLAREVDSGKA